MPFGNAVGEGFNNGEIVIADKVIVFGPGEGVFIYDGTPALGNGPIFWATGGTVDPYGNSVFPQAGTFDTLGGFFTVLSNGLARFAASMAALSGGYAASIGTGNSVDGQLVINGGQQSNTDTSAEIILASRTVGGGHSITSIISDLTSLNSSGTPIPVSAPNIITLPHNPNDPNYGGSGGTLWISGERAFMDNNWVDNINANFSAIMTLLNQVGVT